MKPVDLLVLLVFLPLCLIWFLMDVVATFMNSDVN